MAGFPKKDHQTDTITGKADRLALNILIEALHKNAASIATLKGGGRFGHTALCMSPVEYTTNQRSLPFLLATPPGELKFTPQETLR